MSSDSLLTIINQLNQASHESESNTSPSMSQEYAFNHNFDSISLELTDSLIPLAQKEHPNSLITMIQQIRRQIFQTFGFVVPRIKIIDNLSIEDKLYRICLYGQVITQFKLYIDRKLVISPSGMITEDFPGIHVQEPSFNMPASWIMNNDITEEIQEHYLVVDPVHVLRAHILEILQQHMHELFDYHALQEVLSRVTQREPLLIHALHQSDFSLPKLIHVLRDLLKNQIAIYDMSSIIHTCLYYDKQSESIEDIIEHVRQSLARFITHRYINEEEQFNFIQLDPELEQYIMRYCNQASTDTSPLQPVLANIRVQLKEVIDQWQTESEPAMLIFSSATVRKCLDDFFHKSDLKVAVLFIKEILPHTTLQPVAHIKSMNDMM